MIWVEDTVKIINKVGNGEWNKIQHNKKQKNHIQNKNNNIKNKHHNQDAGRGQTGTKPTGIIRKSYNYQGGVRGSGVREDMNQQHVGKTIIRFKDTKPVEPKPKPIQPEQEQKDLIHNSKSRLIQG